MKGDFLLGRSTVMNLLNSLIQQDVQKENKKIMTIIIILFVFLILLCCAHQVPTFVKVAASVLFGVFVLCMVPEIKEAMASLFDSSTMNAPLSWGEDLKY